MSEIKTYFDSFPSTVESKVYVKDKTEFFELVPDEGEITAAPLKAFSQELGQSAVDFLYAPEHEIITERLLHSGNLVRKIKEDPKNELAWKDFFEIAKLAERHPFYLFLLCSIVNAYKTGMNDKNGNLLPDEYFAKIGREYQELQAYINCFCESYFDFTMDDAPDSEKYRGDLSEGIKVFLENIYIELIPKAKNKFVVKEEIRPQSLPVIGRYLFYKYLSEGVEYKRCENCQKYFVTTGRSNVKYCDHIFEDTGKNCRQIAPKETFHAKVKNDPAEKIYTSVSKTMYSRVTAGKCSKKYYKEWSKAARKLRDECKQGIITFEVFSKWLDDSLNEIDLQRYERGPF